VGHFRAKAQVARTSCAAWVRTHKLLAMLLPVLVVALAVGATLASSGGGNAGSAAAGSGGGTDSVAASTGVGTSSAAKGSGSSHGGGRRAGSGKQVHVPTQPAVTKGEKWLTGPAGKLLSTVNTDVGKISADQRAGMGSAEKSLGALLAADAKAALDGPMPPVRAVVYRAALEDFEQIGEDAVSGNFSKSGSLLTTANLDMMSVTTTANTTAPVNSPAQVNDPSDG
jgi:hypothetical protein